MQHIQTFKKSKIHDVTQPLHDSAFNREIFVNRLIEHNVD